MGLVYTLMTHQYPYFFRVPDMSDPKNKMVTLDKRTVVTNGDSVDFPGTHTHHIRLCLR